MNNKVTTKQPFLQSCVICFESLITVFGYNNGEKQEKKQQQASPSISSAHIISTIFISNLPTV
ncbi:hypothetical protein BLD50_14470 [Bacillus cereus]|nr:hypothetical protein BLD50_14470 [Bacillus cereus]